MNKVLFCGAGYGAGNIGDDAILEGLLISARAYLRPDTEYGALTFNPAFTRSNTKIDQIFNFYVDVDIAFSWATHIVLGGGSLLSGWSIECCSDLIAKAHAMKKPICMLAAGTSVESKDHLKWLLKTHFGSLDMITLRSETDRELAISWELHPDKVYVTADGAFTIDHNLVRYEPENLLGINLVDDKLKDGNSYIDAISHLLTDHKPEMNLFFICGEMRKTGNFDYEILSNLHSQFGGEFFCDYVHYLTLLKQLARCKVIVTMRMHIMIFCALIGIPCIPIIREPKMHLMADSLGFNYRLSLNFSASVLKDLLSYVIKDPNVAMADVERVNALKLGAMRNGEFLCKWMRHEIKTPIIKLNLGSGPDHRSDFVNIDIDPFSKPDEVMDFSEVSLLTKFTANSVDFILAHDIIEHLWRGNAIRLLKDCFTLMKLGGKIEFILPDIDAIVGRQDLSSEQMIEYIFGAQHPNPGQQLYGHAYGYTRQSFTKLLQDVGFSNVQTSDGITNMVVTAEKV